jgi:RNA polymerase sigma-70 factor (ECF subfamily)
MISEKSLLEQVIRFDEQALIEVYDRYSPEIYRYAGRLLADQELAEECVAETFSRFLNGLKHGNRPRQNLRAYLFRIAHNWITDFFRKQPPSSVMLDPELISGSHMDMQDSLIRNLEEEQIRAALQLLTPDQRQVMILRYIEGWRNKEIAQAMDKPVGAVKSLHHRALNSLRRILVHEHEVVS